MQKLRLGAFTLLLVSTLLLPMRVSAAQLDMDDGATSGDLFDRIPPPITDFFIPAQQVSVGPPTKRSASDFIGRIYAPKPEDWKVRSDARPITGVTVTIKSGSRAGESVITNNSGYYRFPNVRGDELHLRVEKEHFEPKEVIVHRSHLTILANGDVLNYPEDVQQNPGSILMGQSWPDEVRFILEETLVVHDLLYAEGGAPPVGEDIGGFYSRGIIVIYSHQYANWQDPVGVLGTFAHEIAHAHQHALVTIDGSAWEVHDWVNTPEGKAFAEAREKDWKAIGKAMYDSIGYNSLVENAAETCAHYWSVDRWGGRAAYGKLEVEAPNRFKWAAIWLPKQSGRIQPLSKISGDSQTGLSNTPLPHPFAVVVRNLDDGFPLSGVSIMFAVTAGGGTLSAPRATTDHTGIAEATLTLGPNIGTNTVSVSAVGIEGTVTFNAVAEGPVDIPDANLRAAIEDTLDKTPGTPIAPAEIVTMTRLEARNAGISDLTGLEYATNLEILGLGGESVDGEAVNSNTIANLSPLMGLTNLTRLNLWGNNISDISAVAGLTKLTSLYLGFNNISDISAVADLTNLLDLGLEGNNISDISAVTGLTNLTWLNLGANFILDVSMVAVLTKLAWLNLGSNNVSDVSVLAGLTQLTTLYLWHNNISDISPLVENTGLGVGDEIYVRGNPLSYLSIHAHIPALQSRAVTVEFDNRTHPALLKISGDNQNGAYLVRLSQPFVVEAQDANGSALAGISVAFTVTAGGGTLNPTITRSDPNGRAQSTLILGPNLGTNTVEVSAAGIESPATFYAIADSELPPTTADVNSDGFVNVLDLILIASSLGQSGQNDADVNGDGVVSILDLILVAGMFDGVAAAPSIQLQAPETLTTVEVQGWLTDARSLEVRDPIMKRGVMVLEQLLVSLTPTETELLSNYPNPFNPETWIPYRLAEDAFVTLTIYDLNGRIIRTLDVGHRIASSYESRSKAIYWDGKNGLGEQVASGVYFYTLTAGDFSATRKMLILK